MAEAVAVTWQGERYDVERKAGQAAAPDPAPVWQVLRDGALLTTFPANPNDGPGEVREKVIAWLEANASRPATDIGRH
jgi:hypothetical protein